MRGMLRNGSNLNFQNTVRAVSSKLDLTTGQEVYAGRLDHDNASVASCTALTTRKMNAIDRTKSRFSRPSATK